MASDEACNRWARRRSSVQSRPSDALAGIANPFAPRKAVAATGPVMKEVLTSIAPSRPAILDGDHDDMPVFAADTMRTHPPPPGKGPYP